MHRITSEIMNRILLYILFVFLLATVSFGQTYNWEYDRDNSIPIHEYIAPPDGFERVAVDSGSFAFWLRNLPVKTDETQVYLFDGTLKRNQSAQFAIVDIDVGRHNLQQCADAVMRLRAEYLYSKAAHDSISFDFTSGDEASFRKWINGYRPTVDGPRVRWDQRAVPDSSYISFRNYLEVVFTYAGSYSLSKEMYMVPDINDIRIGDVFIQGGFPGHAVIVLDVAKNIKTDESVFILAQSYMPAQDVHVLKNPKDENLSPWYATDFGTRLFTPEWLFYSLDLKRF